MLKDEILALRAAGYNYSQIVAALGCSKGTVAYYCGTDQKEKTRNRLRAFRQRAHPLIRKLERFLGPSRRPPSQRAITHRDARLVLYRKIKEFGRVREGTRWKHTSMSFTVEDLLTKIGPNPVCALTGRPLDLTASATYALDHITPRARGGDNSLENCQLVCRDVNQAKHSMLLADFVTLCRDVVRWAEQQNIPR